MLKLVTDVRSGSLSPEEAVEALRHLPYEDLGFAHLDAHRELRTGFPEVIFGQGKTPEQITSLVQALAQRTDRLLVTRVGPEVYDAVRPSLPEACYNATAHALYIDRSKAERKEGVLVVSAGTADLPVAEEAALTAELLSNSVQRIIDVGVAGIHRLLDKMDALRKARVIVVVAGMDGALPSVIGGLVAAPVIAVPTSVGYGAHFQGLAPLLTMLNSCAPGVAVVNIDNGFGGGYMAGLINQQRGD